MENIIGILERDIKELKRKINEYKISNPQDALEMKKRIEVFEELKKILLPLPPFRRKKIIDKLMKKYNV